MKVKDSIYASHILKEVSLSVGTFYFFKNFIVSEVLEGALFDWNVGKKIIEEAELFYGKDPEIHYISNRIYTYAVEPTGWKTFYQLNKKLTSMSVVLHRGRGKMNLIFERLFYPGKIKDFKTLDDAIRAIPNKGF